MKVLALYLPQYHAIQENDEWWGKGYTEWSAVKGAEAYFKGHKQPRVPIDHWYYDLSDPDARALKKQAELARQYQVYGFVFYHYWFKAGKQLLEKPMKILLAHKEIRIHYAVCWANESWTRTWYGLENKVLMRQEYGGEEEWTSHFNYLLPFFSDERYIKIDNKPVIHIYHSYEIEDLRQMIDCWQKLAKDNGFGGVYIICGNTGGGVEKRQNIADAYYNFEPSYSLIYKTRITERIHYGLTVRIRELCNKLFKKKVIERQIDGETFINRMVRDDIISGAKIYPCVFPQWDNTPRRKYKGTCFMKMTPQTFRDQIEQMMKKYPDADFLYVNAWNEWGEGAYLEPDTENGSAFLEELADAVGSKQDHMDW